MVNRSVWIWWPGRKLWYIDRTGNRRAVIFVRKCGSDRVVVSTRNNGSTFIVSCDLVEKVYPCEKGSWNAW